MKCLHCGRPIELDDGVTWYHPDTMSTRCDGPDDEDGIAWGDMVRQAEPDTTSGTAPFFVVSTTKSGYEYFASAILRLWDGGNREGLAVAVSVEGDDTLTDYLLYGCKVEAFDDTDTVLLIPVGELRRVVQLRLVDVRHFHVY